MSCACAARMSSHSAHTARPALQAVPTPPQHRSRPPPPSAPAHCCPVCRNSPPSCTHAAFLINYWFSTIPTSLCCFGEWYRVVSYPPKRPQLPQPGSGRSHSRVFGNSCLISHTIYSQQVKRRAIVRVEGDLVELGREKGGLRGPPYTHPISVASETGVSSQQERCSRDTERLILSPGRWQGEGPSSTGTPGYRSARSEASSGGLAGAHRCSGGTFASGADLR